MSTESIESQRVAAAQDAFASVPQQQEMPLAVVHGEPMLQMPQDLYIPPDALEVILEAFEGPLDLLLYLIRRQNIDILDIPVAEITRQYMAVHRDDARCYAPGAGGRVSADGRDPGRDQVAAAVAAPAGRGRLEEDPRAELVRRLQEYEQFKQAAEDIDELPRLERDTVVAHADTANAT